MFVFYSSTAFSFKETWFYRKLFAYSCLIVVVFNVKKERTKNRFERGVLEKVGFPVLNETIVLQYTFATVKAFSYQLFDFLYPRFPFFFFHFFLLILFNHFPTLNYNFALKITCLETRRKWNESIPRKIVFNSAFRINKNIKNSKLKGSTGININSVHTSIHTNTELLNYFFNF